MSIGQPVRVKSPLGDALIFRSMTFSDELGRLSTCELEMLSDDEDINLDDLLGESLTVEIDLPVGGPRYINGFVSEAALIGRREGKAHYTATVRPWFWFLTRRADCRIFQDKTVPEIIKEIFSDRGFSDLKDTLTRTYRKWEYCVQYRETDFNFVSRLMEQEGIYYYFEYEDGKNTLVLSDAYSAHNLIQDYDEIRYIPAGQTRAQEQYISSLSLVKTVTSGAYALSTYWYKRPTADLLVDLANAHNHAHADYELFDYPGEYFETSEGDGYVEARLQEVQARYERVRCSTNCMALAAGGLFSLTEFPRDDQNREYLIVSTTQTLSLGDHTRSSGATLEFHCEFEAMDSQLPFRSERLTPKPIVQGPQTAIVSGPDGEEIHTDDDGYGRVKVKFRWDRNGPTDGQSSCWIRVAQIWAGAQWGGMTIPRIGQEVIVNFIEGDPDRPIITGRVYNADNMPPYELPANKTQSGIKSRSSKGGSGANFNEIRFEDLKGSEEMYIHAEKDQNIMVENDKGENVGHDNTESVGNDETIDVGNNRDKTVGNDQSESIGANKTITVGSNHTESIGANKKVDVASNHSESVGSNMTINVGSNLTETIAINYAETVGAAMELTIGAAMTETVGANKSQTIGNNKSETIGDSLSVDVGKNQTFTIGESGSYDFGKKLSINAGDEILIATGKAKILMKKDGTINIEGKDILIKGSGAINVKASKDIVIKGKKILEN